MLSVTIKRAQNLQLAKAKMRFDKIKEKYGGAVTTAQFLEEFKGSKEEVFAKELKKMKLKYVSAMKIGCSLSLPIQVMILTSLSLDYFL